VRQVVQECQTGGTNANSMRNAPRPATDVHEVVRKVSKMNKHSLTFASEVIA
jgi:hypothetical protein